MTSAPAILLVEDNDDDAMLTGMAFKKSQIPNPVRRVRDGVEALDYLFAQNAYAARDVRDTPAVVLLDLNLPRLSGILTDQHLHERDRIGRTITLLARLVADGWTSQPRAIAADRETALHVDPLTGIGEVYATTDHATPYVYFLSTAGPPERCEPGTPLTFAHIAVYRIGPGGRFDLDAWRGEGGIEYTLDVTDGVLTSSRGEVY